MQLLKVYSDFFLKTLTERIGQLHQGRTETASQSSNSEDIPKYRASLRAVSAVIFLFSRTISFILRAALRYSEPVCFDSNPKVSEILEGELLLDVQGVIFSFS